MEDKNGKEKFIISANTVVKGIGLLLMGIGIGMLAVVLLGGSGSDVSPTGVIIAGSLVYGSANLRKSD